jgi:type II secretory pathway component PulC
MKKLLILLNLILVPVSYFGYCYYKDTPPRKDYSNYAIRTDSGKSAILQVVSGDATISSKEVDEVINAVPFDPKRCGEPQKQEKKKPSATPAKPTNLNLKLVGICQMGKRSGAVIIDNSRHHPAPRPRVFRAAYRGRGVRRPASPVIQPQKQEANKSRYYRIGDKLPCGYNLKEIKEESVMLAQGNNTFELKLEDAETTSKTAAALPEKRIISAKGNTSRAAAPNKLNHNRNITSRGHRR